MIATLLMALSLVLGIRWPGVLLAGLFFTYQSRTLAARDSLGIAFVIAAFSVNALRMVILRVPIRLTTLDIFFLGMIGWMCATPAFSASPATAQLIAGRLFLSLSVFFVARMSDFRRIDRTLVEMLIGLVVLGALMSNQLSAAAVAIKADRLAIRQAAAVGLAQPLPFEFIAGILCMVVVGSLKRIPFLIAILVCLAIILHTSFQSATRSIFVADGLALLVFLAAYGHNLKVSRMAILLPAAAIFGTYLVLHLGSDRALQSSFDRLLQTFTSNQTDLSVAGRLSMYRTAGHLFMTHPLMGTGIGGYMIVDPYGAYPHNLFMELAAEFGLLGLCLFGAYAVAMGAAFHKIRRNPEIDPFVGATLLCMVAVALIQQQFSGAFFMQRPLFIMTGVLASLSSASLARRPAEYAPRPGVETGGLVSAEIS